MAVVEGDPFAEKNRAWWDGLKVSPVERLHLLTAMTILATIGEVTRFETARQLVATPDWGPACMTAA